MKKLMKFAYTAVFGVSLLALNACTEEYSYDAIAAESGQEVYFPTTNATSVDLEMADDTQTFQVPISRVKANDALTVNISLNVAQNSSLFSIPSSVSFAAGETEALIPVSYQSADLGYENPDTLTISIADSAAVTPYGANSCKVVVVVPSPLEDLGTGSFTDNFWFEETAPVRIYQNTLNRNEFRVMDPFAMCAKYSACTGNQSPYVTLTLLQPGQSLAGVEITQNDLVYFTSINTGYLHPSYSAEIWLYHPAAFSSLRIESAWAYSKVVEYQENGLPGRIQLAPYYYMDGVGGWNQTTANDVVIIDFPGFVPKDYALDLLYSGIFTDAAGAVYAEALATLGEDVNDARAIVVSADADAEAVADAILAGDVEATPVSGGQIRVPIEEGLTGKLQIVVVVIDDEKVKAVNSVGFEYYGGGKSPWESLGIGLYTEDFITSVFGIDPVTYEVEIEENSDTPGLYRLLNPYDGKFPYNEEGDWDATADYNIEVNAIDPDGVYIELQSTGVDWSYGEIEIVSHGARYLGNYSFDDVKGAGYLGTLKDGIITLPTFERQTSDGETAYYQGLTVMGGSGYYGGSGNFKVVLPSAVSASARRAAASQAKALSFERRLKGNLKVAPKKLFLVNKNKVSSHLLMND